MPFDPLNPSGAHSNFVIEASRIAQSCIGSIRAADDFWRKLGQPDPIHLLFDLGDRAAVQLARETLGDGHVEALLTQRDGGSPPGTGFRASSVQSYPDAKQFLVSHGYQRAADELTPPSSPANLKTLVFCSGEVTEINAERLTRLRS
jgi:hypothetical protein